ncbi:MAG: acetamidase/formamidase family protein [Pseudomonadota bacterium]
MQTVMRTTLLLGSVALWSAASADTSDQKWQSKVLIAKDGEHCVDDPNCFNRYHPEIPTIATAKPGDYVTFETRDALDSDLQLDSVAEDLAAVDLNLVHPMTGPLFVETAERGDVLAVTLIDIIPDEYGYTVIAPGFGFLRDIYTEPYVVNWKLDNNVAVSDQMPGIAVPFEAFLGSVGTLPGEDEVATWKAREAALAAAGGAVAGPEPSGALPTAVCGPEGSHAADCLRTIPPRENGGNMDVQQMQIGTTMLFPCFIDGCGLFIGDVHYAQGDGEVGGTAIETGAVVTVKVDVRKGVSLPAPQVEGGAQIKAMEPSKFYQTVGLPLKDANEIPPTHSYIDGDELVGLSNLSEDLTLAARHALKQMIDYLTTNHNLTPEQAYILSSIAVDLRVGQVVDIPNYVVTAVLNMDVFQE